MVPAVNAQLTAMERAPAALLRCGKQSCADDCSATGRYGGAPIGGPARRSFAPFSPYALSPYALSPYALSPYALSPYALSPYALSPSPAPLPAPRSCRQSTSLPPAAWLSTRASTNSRSDSRLT